MLDELTAHLADSLDYTRTLRTLPRLLVPRLADYGLVDVLTDDGQLERLADAHADPNREPLLSLGRVYRMSIDAAGPVAQVLRSGRARIIDPLTSDWLTRAMRYTPEQRRVVEQLGPETDRLLEGLERIQGAATRMERMMNELLDAARLQTGEPLVLERGSVDLVRLVREAVAEQQSGTDRHALRFASDIEQLIGEWDAQRLRRVLDNLLSNAVKYSPAGGEIVVRVAQERAGDQDVAVVQVSDQGLGIPAEDPPHILERFRRARNATEIAGTGLGLAGARQLVEQHGGSIQAESQEGIGSTFTVRLPLRDPTTGQD